MQINQNMDVKAQRIRLQMGRKPAGTFEHLGTLKPKTQIEDATEKLHKLSPC